MDALSKLDEFLPNPQVRNCSEAVPGTSRNYGSENREPSADPSVRDPCPEAMLSPHHSGILNGSELEESHHMVTRVTEEIRNRHHKVAGVTEEIGNRHHMVTRVTEEIRNRHHKVTRTQEDIPYCSTGTSSANKRRRALQFSHNFAAKTPLR